MRTGKPAALLLLFGLVSLGAVAVGAWVCAASGAPASSWIRNLVAWGVGGLLAAVLARAAGGRRSLMAALALAPIGLAVTFLGPDQEGVHRWIVLGPLHVNMAMLVLPAAVVAVGGLAGDRAWPWLVVLAMAAVLASQPDASQATALAGAALAAAAVRRVRPAPLALVAAAVALAALAWLRPDPLQPVPEVEEVIGLAFRVAAPAGAAMLALLAGAAAAPALAARSTDPTTRAAAWGLAALFLLWIATTFLGAYPVPFAGVGMSPIMGGWLGVGLLAGLARTRNAGDAT